MKMAGITGAAGGPDTCRKTAKHGAPGHDSALRKVAQRESQSRDCGSLFSFWLKPCSQSRLPCHSQGQDDRGFPW